MTDSKVPLHQVKSIDVGKLGSNEVALRINFATSAAELKEGKVQNALFGLSHELASGLAKALTTALENTTTPMKARQTHN